MKQKQAVWTYMILPLININIKKGDEKMRIKIYLLILTILIAAVFPVFAEETKGPEVSGSASVDIMSNYVWRGQRLSDGYVVQPSAGITYEAFGVNLWGNWDSDQVDSGTGEHTETDLTLNYTYSIDKLSLDFGYIYYALEGTPNDTQEFYVSAGYDTILAPSLTYFLDVDEGDGSFITASIGHSIELAEKVSLNLGASASINFDNAVMGTNSDGDTFTGLYNGELSSSVSIALNDAISIEPKIAYSFPLSDDAEEALEAIADASSGDKEGDIVYGGINITLSF